MSNQTQISQFVLLAIQPKNRNQCLNLPGVLDLPATEWQKGIELAQSQQSLATFLSSVRKSPEYGQLFASVRELIEKSTDQENLRLAVDDNEVEFATKGLSDSHIHSIVLHGIELGRRFYPERTDRSTTRLEIVVPMDCYSLALRALGRLGYRLNTESKRNNSESVLSRADHLPNLILKKSFRENEPETLSQPWWERSNKAETFGFSQNVRVLSIEDEMVYLVIHGVTECLLKHPVHLNDLSAVISKEPQLDWDRVVWELSHQKALVAGWFAFQLLEREWNTTIPPEIMQGMARRVGLLRKNVLTKFRSIESWWDYNQKDLTRLFSSKFLLHDGISAAAVRAAK